MKACTNHKPEESIASHFEEAREWRHQLHRNPQPAWLEFYSTGFVAEKLFDWGYKLQLGKEIIDESKRLVVPDEATLRPNMNGQSKPASRKSSLRQPRAASLE